MYYTYILECADKTFYTGITVDLERRTKEHNDSKLGAKYTKARRPVKVIYSQKFSNRSLASKEEFRIKNLPREKKLELISHYSVQSESLLHNNKTKMAKGNASKKKEVKKKKKVAKK